MRTILLFNVCFLFIQVNVTITDKSDEAYKLKEIMRKKGTEKIREQLGKYMEDLKQGM